MKHIVFGTAGHIDHGKSALVRALTGIEPDRWEEEKRRGITIDLGFAHLILGDPPHALRAAFIDVPGHERFVRNMLAGAGGIDAVLLVIAADESVMPQTREHFDICRLLGIRHGLIVLTKSDLVSPDLLDLVRLETEDFVRGSFLEGAPILPVSAKTGAGLDPLKAALHQLASRIEAKSSARPLRLPIDRAFTMKGFGTVVTGTLVSGRLRVDDEIEIHPLNRTFRVRGLHVHGYATNEATAGQRTAVNLAAVEAADLARGMTLTTPGLLRSTQRIDAEIELLPSARPLKHNAPLHFHAWTSETPATIKLLDRNLLQPGHKTWARLHLDQPVLLLPGDRFILRSFAPPITIAGGAVIDIDPPLRQRRAALSQRTAALASASIHERIAQLVRESPHGLSPAELIARTGLRRDELSTQGSPPDWFVDPQWIAARRTAIETTLAAFHKRNPLLPGMPLEELRSRTLGDAPPFLLDHIARDWPTLVIQAETARLSSWSIAFQDDEAAALDKIESAFAAAGLAAPSTNEVLAHSGVPPAKAKTLLQLLLRQRRLIRVNTDLVYHAQAIDTLRQLLAARKGARFSVSDFKDWTNVSRKYAIPLLEFLDRERLTRRDGDSRLIL